MSGCDINTEGTLNKQCRDITSMLRPLIKAFARQTGRNLKEEVATNHEPSREVHVATSNPCRDIGQ